jgi:hypothetical protein
MSKAMKPKIVQVSMLRLGRMGAIPVSFNPKAAFGKVRAPVRVTVNRYTFRSTIARMGGETFIPFRKSHREAAAVEDGDRFEVKIEFDPEKRTVKAPPDLASALKSAGAWKQWQALSYTHQRESVEAVEEAKKPETRERRILNTVRRVLAGPATRTGN